MRTINSAVELTEGQRSFEEFQGPKSWSPCTRLPCVHCPNGKMAIATFPEVFHLAMLPSITLDRLLELVFQTPSSNHLISYHNWL